ncbi:hypothetical protein CEXT_75831 [Caerostris extrusa]|uniref:Uncharacterized protein n=1 Tax=Caerostris extrusa TaxID=172846 RepID=A0AAV4WWJ2_CAEEX|nr:hypothetical protein CEXT_75831 [Caerostris extrusa]
MLSAHNSLLQMKLIRQSLSTAAPLFRRGNGINENKETCCSFVSVAPECGARWKNQGPTKPTGGESQGQRSRIKAMDGSGRTDHPRTDVSVVYQG